MRTNKTIVFTILIFLLWHAILMLTQPLLPFTDLPNHLSEATIFKYSDDPTLATYYTVVPGFYPNTFHTVFCALFPDVEWGNKVFFILYMALLLFSVYATVRRLGGNAWYGLLSIFFIYNYNTTWGFTGFTIAIPVTILLFYITLRDVGSKGYRYTLAAGLLLVLLYLMHAQVALLGMALYGLMLLYGCWPQWKKMLAKGLLALAPVVIMVSFWWWHRAGATQEESTLSYLAAYYSRDYLPEFYRRFWLLAYDNMALQPGRLGQAIGGLFSLLLLVPLAMGGRKTFGEKNFWRQRQFVFPALFFALCLGAYFILPNELPGQGPLHERFCTLVFLSFIILASTLLRAMPSRKIAVFAIAASLVYTVLWSDYIMSFNRQTGDFNRKLLAGIQPEKKLAGLMYQNKFRGREVYIHFPNYNLVWNRGITATKIIDYRFGVVRRGARGGEIPFYEDWIGDSYKVVPAYRDSIQYLLQKGPSPLTPDGNTAHAQLLWQKGEWRLYSNEAAP